MSWPGSITCATMSERHTMEVGVAAKYVSPAGSTLVTCHACECRLASQISPGLLALQYYLILQTPS